MQRFNIVPQEQVLRGQPITADAWNTIAEAINVLQAAGLIGSQLGYGPVLNREQPTSIVQLRRFLFKEFVSGNKDYFHCYDPDDTTDKTAIAVAKPEHMRPSRTSHGGHTITWTSDTARDVDGEDQVLEDATVADDEVIVIGPVDTGVLDDETPQNSVLWYGLSWLHKNWGVEPAS